MSAEVITALMSYVPVHERVHPPAYPLYSSMSDEPSRKRRRESPGASSSVASRGGTPAPQPSAPTPPPAPQPSAPVAGISPSIFGIAPRNEVTRVIGEFIMKFGRGIDNLEIEIKLGTVLTQGPDRRRVRLPALTESLLPSDYPSTFSSTMSWQQHASINKLLNSAVANSRSRVRFSREHHIDSLYPVPGEKDKVRVSRDLDGHFVASVMKKRLADLNVHSPSEAFDWRVSVSTETPVPFDDTGKNPVVVRDKDRAAYTGDTCRVDLTKVITKGQGPPSTSYELEIEVLDAAALVAEGEKEERGEPNVFDETLQSVLDTARMIIRNV